MVLREIDRQEARVGLRHAARAVRGAARCCATPSGRSRTGRSSRKAQPIPDEPGRPARVRARSASIALYFGNGYMIHGTLYERLLGRAVSHGCIRVGRDDLRKVWANARIGTQIYIYWGRFQDLRMAA
ncbi:MAG: L,D-transpeptidase [Desulfobacterales bacterium]|nr:L,D-transpeptidase [Desulfobacterales bacterium]